LFRRGGDWSVYVVENGRAEIRAVEVLRRSGGFAAIGKGLRQDHRVIVYPGDQVGPGVRVVARP
jgi:HlyD family secretion protein